MYPTLTTGCCQPWGDHSRKIQGGCTTSPGGGRLHPNWEGGQGANGAKDILGPGWAIIRSLRKWKTTSNLLRLIDQGSGRSIPLMICTCKRCTSPTCHFIIRLVTDHSWWSRVSDAHRLEETKILADDATRDLEKAMPALDAAVDALEKLDKKSIAEASGLQKGVDTKWSAAFCHHQGESLCKATRGSHEDHVRCHDSDGEDTFMGSGRHKHCRISFGTL